MILIYTQQLTPRINYTFHQVLERILGFEVKFTAKIEKFIASNDMKFSYGQKRLGNELFMKSNGLLTEQGVTEIDIKVRKWDELPCFFYVGEESDIPFDIFSAAFYMLTRYEEYLPHVKDDMGRYPAEESLAYKNKFLQRPVVDLWAYKLKAVFRRHFPKFDFPERTFKEKNILAVAQIYKYRKKGIVRNIGGGIKELIHLKLKAIFERVRTQLLWAKDPYDIYDKLLKFSKQNQVVWEFMFQLSDYSIHNKNIGYNNRKYHTMIKSLGDYGKIGLLIGYEALFDLKELKKEKNRWENIVNRELEMALNNDYCLNLPELYNNYDNLEIGHDYSMGFVRKMGFRAGTCTPFLYYDLNLEHISPLVLHPTAFNSSSFKASSFFEIKTILERIKGVVKEVDGHLLMLFKNSDFEEGPNQEKYFQLIELMNNHG